MAAYVIADVQLHDPEAFKPYSERVPDVIARHGGSYLVRGGEVEVKEGDWHPKRIVVLRFEDMDAARRWYESPEYAELIALRQQSSTTNLLIVDGYPGA